MPPLTIIPSWTRASYTLPWHCWPPGLPDLGDWLCSVLMPHIGNHQKSPPIVYLLHHILIFLLSFILNVLPLLPSLLSLTPPHTLGQALSSLEEAVLPYLHFSTKQVSITRYHSVLLSITQYYLVSLSIT